METTTTMNYAKFIRLRTKEEFEKVLVLDFSDSNLKRLPQTIGQCINLEALYCHGNELEELPESLGNCIHLKELICAENKLTRLPQSLGNCIHLKELVCVDNKLTGLPTSLVKCTRLQYLLCQNNKLGILPDLLQFKRLRDLDCSYNKLREIPCFNKLTHVTCHHNPFMRYPEPM